jgi:hypothetical protein
MDASLRCALLSMTSWGRGYRTSLRSVQHDKRGVIPSESEESSAMWMLHFACALFSMTRWCHSERERGIQCGCFASLRSVQHDKLGSWIPHFADASVSMTRAVSFRARARNPVHGCFTSLRSVQHDKLGSWIPHFADASVSMTSAVSFRARARNPVRCGCFTSLRSVQHDKRGVIPSESEESSAWMLHFACALFSMTSWGRGYRTSLMLRSA